MTLSALLLLLLFSGSVHAHTIDLPADLVLPGETLQTVADGFTFTEGPVTAEDNTLYFTDQISGGSIILRVPPGSTPEIFRPVEDSDGANGLVIDADGALLACESGGVSRTSPGGTRIVIGTAADLDGANDITLLSDGSFYVTDPVWEGNGQVFYGNGGGTLVPVLSSLAFPNGIEAVEEKNRLYLCISQADRIDRYTIDPSGALVNPVTVVSGITIPDGLALDTGERLWVASHTSAAVVVYDSLGNLLGSITLDGQESVQNCAFGGPGRSVLYIAARTAVYTLPTLVEGRSTTGGEQTSTRSGFMVAPGSGDTPGAGQSRRYDLQGRILPGKVTTPTPHFKKGPVVVY